MRHVLDNSRGIFFRWISHDDWLEPGCLSSCVRALESRPDAIGVTSWFTIHTPDGSSRYEEYRGEFPDSSDAAGRFRTHVVVLPRRRRKTRSDLRHVSAGLSLAHRFPPPVGANRLADLHRTGAAWPDHQFERAACEPYTGRHPASIAPHSGVASIPPRRANEDLPPWPVSRVVCSRDFGRSLGSAVAPLQIGASAFLGQGADQHGCSRLSDARHRMFAG